MLIQELIDRHFPYYIAIEPEILNSIDLSLFFNKSANYYSKGVNNMYQQMKLGIDKDTSYKYCTRLNDYSIKVLSIIKKYYHYDISQFLVECDGDNIKMALKLLEYKFNKDFTSLYYELSYQYSSSHHTEYYLIFVIKMSIIHLIELNAIIGSPEESLIHYINHLDTYIREENFLSYLTAYIANKESLDCYLNMNLPYETFIYLICQHTLPYKDEIIRKYGDNCLLDFKKAFKQIENNIELYSTSKNFK